MYQPAQNKNSDTTLGVLENINYKLTLENSVLFPDQFVFLYNSYSSEIIYQKGFYDFIGMNLNLFNKQSLLNLIHPEEREKVKNIYNKIYRFWFQNNSSPLEQVFSITYRIIKSNSKYRSVCCQTMIAEKILRGFITLNMVSDISQYSPGKNVLWTLKGKGCHRFYEKNKLDEGEYNLTCRELEIIKCVAKGMDCKEIAKFLKISLYTVYTHRRNMLNKMKFENIIQLVNFAFKKGLINV